MHVQTKKLSRIMDGLNVHFGHCILNVVKLLFSMNLQG